MPDIFFSSIKQARMKRGITATALAQALGVSKAYISQVEAGKKKLSVGKMRLTSDFLHMPIAELLGQSEEPSDPVIAAESAPPYYLDGVGSSPAHECPYPDCAARLANIEKLLIQLLADIAAGKTKQ